MEGIIIGIIICFCTVLCIKYYKLLKNYKELIKVKEINEYLESEISHVRQRVTIKEVQIELLKKSLKKCKEKQINYIITQTNSYNKWK